MNNGRQAKLEALFDEACELPQAQRDEFLRRSCAGDDQLLAELNSLLAHGDHASTKFLEGPPRSERPEAREQFNDEFFEATNGNEPGTFGRYRIIRKIGQGGMGVVYEAEQDHPRRRVALKILRIGLHHTGALRRFEREAQLLAQLQHPAITHIYDAGIEDTTLGQTPFIAMEYIDGVSIKTWARETNPSVEARLKIVTRIADGVHHANQCGIVHRDIKPGNILITKDGKPKILDFGIARVTNNDTQAQTLQTEIGQLLGTVSYMSPEQVGGDSANIEATSDVYALGVLLFELLCDRLPIDLHGRSIPEAVAMIRDREPTHLSSIDARFRGDIDTIVLKAIEKDPLRRYATAAALANDIRRHLRNEPIQARPATTVYQLSKFARRNRGLVTVVMLAFIGLLAATIATTNFALSEARMRRIADKQTQRSNWEAYRSGLLAAQAAIRTFDYVNARRILNNMPASTRTNWEWRHLMRRLDNSDRALTGHHDTVHALTFSHDGKSMLSASADGTLGLWNIETGQRTRTIRTGERSVRHLTYMVDDQRIITVGSANKICIWELEAEQLLKTIDVSPGDRCSNDDCAVLSMTLSTNNRLLAATVNDATVRVWDLDTGQNTLTVPLENHDCGHAIAFNESDDALLVGWFNGLVRIPLSLNQPACIALFQGGNDRVPSSIATHPSLNTIATGCADKSILLWDADSLAVKEKLTGHTGGVRDVAFSHDGSFLASCADDLTIRTWDSNTGQLTGVLAGHTDAIQSIAISPDGELLASGSADHTIRLWKVAPTTREMMNTTSAARNDIVQTYRGHQKHAYRVMFDPMTNTNNEVISLGWTGDILRWDIKTLKTIRSDHFEFFPLRCFDLSTNGNWFAVGNGELFIALIDAKSGKLHHKYERPTGNVNSVIIGAHERIIAATLTEGFGKDSKGAALVWDFESGKLISRYDNAAWYCTAATPTATIIGEFSPDGCRLFNAETEATICEFAGVNTRVFNLTLSNDGSRFLLAKQDGTISIHDATNGAILGILEGHTERVYDAEYSPGMTRIASCSNDNTIRIWDAETYGELLELRGHSHYVHDIAFSPDGSILLSASGDATVGTWRAK